jgi:ribosomal protein L40E
MHMFREKIGGTLETKMTEAPQKAADEKFCSECGAIIKAKAEICPKCGVRQMAAPFVSGLGSIAPNPGQMGHPVSPVLLDPHSRRRRLHRRHCLAGHVRARLQRQVRQRMSLR